MHASDKNMRVNEAARFVCRTLQLILIICLLRSLMVTLLWVTGDTVTAHVTRAF